MEPILHQLKLSLQTKKDSIKHQQWTRMLRTMTSGRDLCRRYKQGQTMGSQRGSAPGKYLPPSRTHSCAFHRNESASRFHWMERRLKSPLSSSPNISQFQWSVGEAPQRTSTLTVPSSRAPPCSSLPPRTSKKPQTRSRMRLKTRRKMWMWTISRRDPWTSNSYTVDCLRTTSWRMLKSRQTSIWP